MADPKPQQGNKPNEPKPPRRKLTASIAMTRFQRMMEELDDKGRKSLLAFVKTLAEEQTPPSA